MATVYESKDDFVRAMDAALEAIVTQFKDTTVRQLGASRDGNGAFTQVETNPRLSRWEILRVMARRAMRKTIQGRMRVETLTASQLPGLRADEPYA
jgi:hypothetical protein